MTIRHTEHQRHDSAAPTAAAAEPKRPWLSRLLGSKRGNVLPILAASILPMAAMIGGAVDMSRAYMVKSRIQHACDAGVLAGRRAMERGSYNDAAKAQAQDFFDINFKAGYNNSTNVVFNTSSPTGSSLVLGSASTVMPTTIMGMFGQETIEIAVNCEAELNLSNTDVTFVLDVTGSMLDSIPTGDSGSIVKITALRNSVISFYDTLAAASVGSNARLRYSFVPYSTNVNVGELLYDTNAQWMIGGNTGETWNYQSRRPRWRTTTIDCQVFGGTQSVACPTRPHTAIAGGGTNITRQRCTNYGSNTAFTGFTPTAAPTDPNTTVTYAAYSWNGAAPNWSGTATRVCVRERTTHVDSDVPVGGATVIWIYEQRAFPVFDFVRSIKASNPAVTTPSEVNGSTSRWSGCIEERDTIAGSTIVYGSNGITVDGSTNAHDLNIDAVPNSAATKWRPHWEDVYFFRNDPTSLKNYGGGYTACPSKATLLATMTKDQVQTYVDALVAVGGTYHDVGLLWGARLASPQGLFQSTVNANRAMLGLSAAT